MLKIKNLFFNPFQECCSIAWSKAADKSENEGVIIDPGFYDANERDELFGFIETNNIKPTAILLTHGHFDHIFGVKETAEHYSIPIYMNSADKVMLENDRILTETFHLKAPEVDFQTIDLKEGDIIRFADEQLEVIATPGHTPGGISLLDRKAKVLFSGDTLFAGSIGRTDHPWGDYDKLIKSVMDKLMGLDGDTVAIPGHGPRTTIGAEAAHNPFLIPFNEPESDWNGMDGIELEENEDKK